MLRLLRGMNGPVGGSCIPVKHGIMIVHEFRESKVWSGLAAT